MKDESYKTFKNCQRATFLIEKRQYSRLSIREWFFLRYHLSSCALCTLFSKQTLVINTLIQKLVKSTEGEPSTLDNKSKESIQSRINEEISKR